MTEEGRKDRFDELLDGVSGRLLDEKVADALKGSSDCGEALRRSLAENMMLKADLSRAHGMLSRVYGLLDRITGSPAFRETMEDLKDDLS